MSDFFEFLRTSFWHVAPILLAGGIGVAIILERVRALYQAYPIRNQQAFFDKLTDLVMSGRIAEAVAFCDRFGTKPVAKIAKAALLRAHQPEHLVEHGIELAVGSAKADIQKRTAFLATIANVATLLGLFGTIAGLIHSFEAVGHADAQQKSALLAAGISQAMNATMLGLAVAIPCMIAFSFLMNKTNRLVGEVEHSAIGVLDVLKQRFYASELGAEAPKAGTTTDVTGLDDEVDTKKRVANGNNGSHLRRVA